MSLIISYENRPKNLKNYEVMYTLIGQLYVITLKAFYLECFSFGLFVAIIEGGVVLQRTHDHPSSRY